MSTEGTSMELRTWRGFSAHFAVSAALTKEGFYFSITYSCIWNETTLDHLNNPLHMEMTQSFMPYLKLILLRNVGAPDTGALCQLTSFWS